MAQCESEARTPKQDLVKEMAHILDVSPRAIIVPEIGSYIGLIHTLFALEDMYGLKIGEIDGKYVCGWTSPPERLSPLCLICSTHDRNRPPVWNRER